MGAVELDAAKAALFKSRGDRHIFVGDLPQLRGRHDVGHGPAIGVRLVGDSFRRGDRAPKLLAAGMPELSNQAGPFAFDGIRGTLEPVVVLALVASHGRCLAQCRGIDRDDFGNDHSGAALGAFCEEADPSIGDAVSCAIVCCCGGQRDPVAQCALPHPQWAEELPKMSMITHVEISYREHCAESGSLMGWSINRAPRATPGAHSARAYHAGQLLLRKRAP